MEATNGGKVVLSSMSKNKHLHFVECVHSPLDLLFCYQLRMAIVKLDNEDPAL